MRSLLPVAKLVSWTLDPDRPPKTGSRYNDTLNCVGKPKGSATMTQKVTGLLGDFWLKLHWGYFYPPAVAGTMVNSKTRNYDLHHDSDMLTFRDLTANRSRFSLLASAVVLQLSQKVEGDVRVTLNTTGGYAYNKSRCV